MAGQQFERVDYLAEVDSGVREHAQQTLGQQAVRGGGVRNPLSEHHFSYPTVTPVVQQPATAPAVEIHKAA